MMAAYFKAVGLAIWLLVAWALMHYAWSAPPPGADPNSAISKWIHTLKNPPRGTLGQKPQSCCDFSDCRPTAIRELPDGRLQGWISKEQFGDWAPNEWQDIDEHAQGAQFDGYPPDGLSWVCWFGGAIQCFAPGWGG